MNKNEFILLLSNRLSFLNEEEMKKHLDFYEEAILDRIDEGMNEEDAVKNLGELTAIVDLIKSEYPNLETKKDEVKVDVKEETKVEVKEELILEKNEIIKIKNDEKENNFNFKDLIINGVLFVVTAILTLSMFSTGIAGVVSSVTFTSAITLVFELGVSLFVLGIATLVLGLCIKYFKKLFVLIKEMKVGA